MNINYLLILPAFAVCAIFGSFFFGVTGIVLSNILIGTDLFPKFGDQWIQICGWVCGIIGALSAGFIVYIKGEES